MIKKVAIIQNSIVVNTVAIRESDVDLYCSALLDKQAEDELPFEFLELEEGDECSIGHTYNEEAGTFTPPVEEEPNEPTE